MSKNNIGAMGFIPSSAYLNLSFWTVILKLLFFWGIRKIYLQILTLLLNKASYLTSLRLFLKSETRGSYYWGFWSLNEIMYYIKKLIHSRCSLNIIPFLLFLLNFRLQFDSTIGLGQKHWSFLPSVFKSSILRVDVIHNTKKFLFWTQSVRSVTLYRVGGICENLSLAFPNKWHLDWIIFSIKRNADVSFPWGIYGLNCGYIWNQYFECYLAFLPDVLRFQISEIWKYYK